MSSRFCLTLYRYNYLIPHFLILFKRHKIDFLPLSSVLNKIRSEKILNQIFYQNNVFLFIGLFYKMNKTFTEMPKNTDLCPFSQENCGQVQFLLYNQSDITKREILLQNRIKETIREIQFCNKISLFVISLWFSVCCTLRFVLFIG